MPACGAKGHSCECLSVKRPANIELLLSAFLKSRIVDGLPKRGVANAVAFSEGGGEKPLVLGVHRALLPCDGPVSIRRAVLVAGGPIAGIAGSGRRTGNRFRLRGPGICPIAI